MQTKKQSLIEASTNTAIGFGISFASTFLILPLVGIETTAGTNLLITVYFTVISILRGYVIRRWFNKSNPKPSEYLKDTEGLIVTAHCFDCETNMPVKITDNDLFCSQCGLKH